MENKKSKVMTIVTVIALALTVITATYAYFNAQVGDSAAADIKINANTVDTFTFATGSQISFSINQENFASGAGNQTGSTYASALLTANNKTNTATENYYLYLNIESNTFTYSIDENTPEIIMTLTDSSGSEITDLTTLSHVIVTGADGSKVSGYDITNKSGLITLFNNREITTTSSKEEKWNVTITFINYDKNQKANAGQSMSAKLLIQKEKLLALEVNDVSVKPLQSGDYFNLKVNVVATANFGKVSNYYYSKDSGETYEESRWSSHIFSGLEPSSTYHTAVYAVDANGNKSDVYTSTGNIPEYKITIKDPIITYDADTQRCNIVVECSSQNEISTVKARHGTEEEFVNNVYKYYISRREFKKDCLETSISFEDVEGNNNYKNFKACITP